MIFTLHGDKAYFDEVGDIWLTDRQPLPNGVLKATRLGEWSRRTFNPDGSCQDWPCKLGSEFRGDLHILRVLRTLTEKARDSHSHEDY